MVEGDFGVSVVHVALCKCACRCMWSDGEDLTIPEESVVTREAFLPAVIQRLREKVEQPRPTLRPSVKWVPPALHVHVTSLCC